MRKHLKWMIPVAVVVVVAAVFVVQGRRGGGNAAAEGGGGNGETILGGRTGTCEIGEISVLLTEVGEIQPESMVMVKSKVSGKISQPARRRGRDGPERAPCWRRSSPTWRRPARSPA